MREGAYTLNARTVREKTCTLPNHTAMLTGRRVDARHGGHGYSENFDNGRTSPSCGRALRCQRLRRGTRSWWLHSLFATKTKFKLYKRTLEHHGAPDRVGRNDGRAKIDRFTIDRNNTRLVCQADRRATPQTARVHLRAHLRYRIVSDTLMASWASNTSPPSSAPTGSSAAS